MIPVSLFLAAVAVANPAPTTTPGGDSAYGDWVASDLGAFHLYTDGAPGSSQAVLGELGRLREIERLSIPDADLQAPLVPVNVFAFRNGTELRHFTGADEEHRPIVETGEFEIDILLALDEFSVGDERAVRAVAHAYEDARLDVAYPSEPLWVREGTAELWSRARIEQGQVIFGQVNPASVPRMAAGPDLPFSDLQTLEPVYAIHGAPDNRYFEEAALLVHFELLGHPDGDDRLFRLRHADGRSDATLFREVVGDPKEVEKQVRSYVTSGIASARVTPVSSGPIASDFRPVPRARLIALLAQAEIALWNPKSANELLQEALAANPDDALARSLRARRELAAGDLEAARSDLRFAASAPDGDFPAYFLSAVWSERDEQLAFVHPEETGRELDRVLVLDSRFVPALTAQALLLEKRDPARAARYASTAATLAPAELFNAFLRARILADTGHSGDADAIVKSFVERAASADEAYLPNNVCWNGAVNGFAKEVQGACDRAVSLSDDSLSRSARDSRGVDRALCGDLDGALDDLRLGIQAPARATRERQRWMARLERHESPFDARTLATLRDAYAEKAAALGATDPFVDPPRADLIVDARISPKPIKQPAPSYPASARNAGFQGDCYLGIVVNGKGRVEKVVVLDCPATFEKSSLSAVGDWRYSPVEVDGQPIVWKSLVHLRFRLR
jgi:tetratricopeptide (TPR) repeat protein